MTTESLSPPFKLFQDKFPPLHSFSIYPLLTKISVILFAISIPISTGATHLLLLSFIFFWFLEGDLKKKTGLIFKNPVSLLALGFFILFLIGATYSQASKNDVIEMLDKMSKFLYIPFLLPLFLDPKLRKTAIFAFVLTMVFVFSLVTLKYFGKVNFPFGNKFTQACLFKNHIDTNLLMSFAAFLMAHTALQVTGRALKLGIWGMVFLFTFYCWFMSVGRSGQVVFLALTLLFFIQHFRWKGVLWGLLLTTCLIFTTSFYSKRFQERWNENVHSLITQVKINDKKAFQFNFKCDTSVKERLHFAKNTLRLIKQKPWIGYGTGSFKEVYQDNAKKRNWVPTNNPHSEYLNIFFQLGGLGLIALLFLFIRFFVLSFRLPILEQRFLQGILVAMGVGMLANSWLMDFTPGYLFILFVGICFGAYQVQALDKAK